MSQKKAPPTEKFNLLSCKNFGHDWLTTTSATWRVCKRERCRASQRLVDGKWVSNTSAYRRHHPVLPTDQQPRQAALWESSQHERKETTRL